VMPLAAMRTCRSRAPWFCSGDPAGSGRSQQAIWGAKRLQRVARRSGAAHIDREGRRHGSTSASRAELERLGLILYSGSD
jgi:hypothetical protein